MCLCMSLRSAVGHGEASGAHNGVQMQLHWLTVLELKSLVLELQAIPIPSNMNYSNAGPFNRFEEAETGIVGELAQILPSELVSSSVQLNPSHFKEVLQLYMDDLPSAKALHTELDLWRTKLKFKGSKFCRQGLLSKHLHVCNPCHIGYSASN